MAVARLLGSVSPSGGDNSTDVGCEAVLDKEESENDAGVRLWLSRLELRLKVSPGPPPLFCREGWIEEKRGGTL